MRIARTTLTLGLGISLGLGMIGLILAPTALQASETRQTGTDWTHKKCTLYQKFRDQTQAPLKQDDLGAEFLQNEAEFVASGCTARSYVCPISATELKYANTLAVLMMNAGATGSFLPYACN